MHHRIQGGQKGVLKGFYDSDQLSLEGRRPRRKAPEQRDVTRYSRRTGLTIRRDRAIGEVRGNTRSLQRRDQTEGSLTKGEGMASSGVRRTWQAAGKKGRVPGRGGDKTMMGRVRGTPD